MRKQVGSVLLACLVVFASGAFATGGEGEVVIGREGKALPWVAELNGAPYKVVPYDSIPFLAGVPRETADYSIDPDVVVSGYYYYFYVKGKDQTYMVGSAGKLVRTLHEIEVLARLGENAEGKQLLAGVGDSAKGIATGLGNLVIHPGVSLKNFGKRAAQTGRGVERAFDDGDDIGSDEAGVDRSQLGEGPAGTARRQIAFELGVDVYTDNPEMRSALTSLSHYRTTGSAASSFVVPYGLGTLSNMNPLAGDSQTEAMIRDLPPAEIRREVGKMLEPLFGISREDESRPLGALLANPNYTPRELAYIGKDFLAMGTVRNLGAVLAALAGAGTPEQADLFSVELRLYSFLHQRVQPLGEFISSTRVFAAMGANGVVYSMLAVDTIRPWAHNVEAFNSMVNDAIARKARGAEIWTIGDVDPVSVENARQHGVVVRQNILRDPAFFPKPEQLQPRAAEHR